MLVKVVVHYRSLGSSRLTPSLASGENGAEKKTMSSIGVHSLEYSNPNYFNTASAAKRRTFGAMLG